jgi:hypothetical protein
VALALIRRALSFVFFTAAQKCDAVTGALFNLSGKFDVPVTKEQIESEEDVHESYAGMSVYDVELTREARLLRVIPTPPPPPAEETPLAGSLEERLTKRW